MDPRAELIEWGRRHHRELYKVRALIRRSMREFEEDPENCQQGMQASIRIADDLADYLGRLKRKGLASGDWDNHAAAATLMGAVFTDAMRRDTRPQRYPCSMRDVVEKYVDLLLSAIGARRPVAVAARGGAGHHDISEND
jgi:hypothetical protein